MYAITPFGAGQPVGARAIEPDWPLADGEAFTVADWHDGLVLAEDGASLRLRQPDDPPATPSIRTISRWAFLCRLPMVKRKAIVAAVGTSATVDYWLHFTAAGPVNLDHPDTISGIDELTAAGLLDRADKPTLLADGTADELP